jgi:hypothetical protein
MKTTVTTLLLLLVMAVGVYSYDLQKFSLEGRYLIGGQNSNIISGVCASGKYLYMVDRYHTLRVFSISETGLPDTEITSINIGFSENLYRAGNYIYGVSQFEANGVHIIDITEPAQPEQICHINDGYEAEYNTVIYSDTLFLPILNYWGASGLRCYSISDIHFPQLLGTYSQGDDVCGLDFLKRDNYGYLSYLNHTGVVLDVSDLGNIQLTDTLEYRAGILENYMHYLISAPPINFADPHITIYDIADPSAPEMEHRVLCDIYCAVQTEMHNSLLYMIGSPEGYAYRVSIYDIAGFEQPHSLASFSYTWEGTPNLPQITVLNDMVYVATGDSGLFALRYTGEFPPIPGDINDSGVLNGIDVTYFVSFFKGGAPIPAPQDRADANGDCHVNGLDVVYLINYFKGGPAPIREICYTP